MLCKLRGVTYSAVCVAAGETGQGSTVPHPEEPARVGGALRTPVEGSLPLGRPSEPTADGQLLLGHGQSCPSALASPPRRAGPSTKSLNAPRHRQAGLAVTPPLVCIPSPART